ncbi:MAG: c-type cytochrome [Candidatus Rokuibacteriota bacterium]
MRASALALAIVTLIMLGCRGEQPPEPPRIGDARRGVEAMERHGCGACHQIPGVRGARGVVGPSLAGFGRRPFIAGALRNDPANLVRWIRDPQAIEPGTVMPTLGVTEVEARDIAGHLTALR